MLPFSNICFLIFLYDEENMFSLSTNNLVHYYFYADNYLPYFVNLLIDQNIILYLLRIDGLE